MEQLITFLNEKQRDPTLNEILYPFYDEKRTMEIINDYEQNETIRSQSESTCCSLNNFFIILVVINIISGQFSCNTNFLTDNFANKITKSCVSLSFTKPEKIIRKNYR